jgi:hypothetical protein
MSVTRYKIVESDTDGEDDLGIISITSEHGESIKHWVTFPDGTVRTMYNSRGIDQTDSDLLEAFDALPVLKVSYGRILKFCYLYEYLSFFVMLVFLFVALAFGLAIALAHQFAHTTTFFDSTAGTILTIILSYGTPVSALVYFSGYVGSKRWGQISKGDLEHNRVLEILRQEKEAKAEAESSIKTIYLV